MKFENKIICGDCLEVMKDWPDGCVDFCLTDPPYGVKWQSHRREERLDMIHNDDNLDWALPVYAEVFRVLVMDSLLCSFYGWPNAEIFKNAWSAAGFRCKSHIVWVKNNIGLGWFTRGKHESAYLLAKGSPLKPSTAIPDVLPWHGTGNEMHPSQKPINAMMPILECYTQPNDIILDPFCGSGTTCVVAKMLGRRYIGIDISPEYCDISRERLKGIRPSLFEKLKKKIPEQTLGIKTKKRKRRINGIIQKT